MTLDRFIKGLLIFVPITLILKFTNQSETLVFIAAALAVVPLADVLGDATEELAHYLGQTLGGLLNATLGNAAELIITVFALREGLVDLVRASITGSIVGNLLIVLGASILFGGLKNGLQKFDRRIAGMNATLLILAVIALAIPSLFDVAIQTNKAAELGLSEGVAVVMIILYGLSVFYTFRSASDHKADREDEVGPAMAVVSDNLHTAPKWSMRTAIIILVVATIAIVFMSEALVGSVESVTESLGLSEFFIGIILIPLIGNVAEHIVAVQVAVKNKMDLSLAVALGSSLQVALFVAPVLVFISLAMGQETLLLVFSGFELIALIASVMIAAFVALDGESNWLEGAMLIALYIIVALAFYFLPVVTQAAHGG